MSADTLVVRMPYGRWRRWVRALRRRAAVVRGDGGGDRLVLAYGLVLLALVYGPMLWTVLAQAGRIVGGATDAVPAVALLMLGVACGLGELAARTGGPLRIPREEAVFALSGQFAPRTVLFGRALATAVGLAAAAAFAAASLASGTVQDAAAAGSPGASSVVASWGVLAALLVQVPLAVGVAAQGARYRRAAHVLTGVLVGLGALTVVVSVAAPTVEPAVGIACLDAAGAETPCPVGGVVPSGALVLAAVVALACLAAMLWVLPDELDVDEAAARRSLAAAAQQGLAVGDASAVTGVLGPETLRRRRATFPAPLLRRWPLVARDLLGLLRRPLPLVTSLAAGLAGALLAMAPVPRAAEAIAVIGGGVLLYAASATWATGLRDLAGQSVPGGLLPGTVARAVRGHLVVPTGVGALVVAVAAASMAGPGGVDGVPQAVVVLVVVLATRAWVSGTTTAPRGLFTPIAGPTGDLSMVAVGAWYLRGWIVVVGAAWLVHRFPVGGAVVVLVVAVALVWALLDRLRRA